MVIWRSSKSDVNEINEEVISCSKSDCAYEITTAALFKPETEVKECGAIRGKGYLNFTCVALDGTIILHDNASREILFSKDFNSEIDDFLLVESESLLVVSLRNGSVHCLTIEEGLELFQGKAEGEAGGKTLVEFCSNVEEPFLLVAKGKKIYRAIIARRQSCNVAWGEVTLECFYTSTSETFSSCIAQHYDGSMDTFLGGSSHLYCYQNDLLLSRTVCSEDNGVQVEKVLSYPDDRIIVCLVSGKLLFFCCLTMLCLKVFDKKSVMDFTLVVSEEEERQALIVVDDYNGNTSLELIDMSGFTCHLNVPIKHAALIDSLYLGDNLVFLEGVSAEGKEEKLVSHVKLSCIAKSSPTDRLNRLLRKNLFEEADEFASKHGLDTQEIHKAQFRQYIQLMQDKDSAATFDLTYATSLIGKINDIEFVIESIFGMSSLHLMVLKSLLSICLEKLDSLCQVNGEFTAAAKCVSERLHLLDTFSILWPNDNEKWTSFVKSSILETFKKSMTKGAWLEAWMIWERHWQECVLAFESVMDVVQILEILALDSDSQGMLLKSIISKAVSHFPDASSAIVDWAFSRLRYLESYENWPDVALTFAENIFSYLDHAKDEKSDFLPAIDFVYNPKRSNWDSLHLLHDVIESLKDIKYFKYELGINIKLSDYDMDEKEQLVHILLCKINNICDYEKLLSGFVMKYVTKHGLSFDAVIEDVVKDFMSTTYWPGELEVRIKKAVALTAYIKDAEMKGRCTLELMKSAPLPWDDALSQLVSTATLLNHPIAESVTLQLNIMNALVTLKKYHLECCHVIQDFEMIITHIISVGNDDMLNDCLSVAATEAKKEVVYTRCSESYIRQRDYKKAFDLWNTLPKKTCIAVLQRIVHSVHAASLIQGFENTDVTYINNLKLLEMHLADVLKDLDEGEYIIEEIPMKKLKGDYFVKKYVDSEAELDDVRQNASLLNKSLSKFASPTYSNMTTKDLLLQMKKLSEILDCGVEEILIDILVNFNEDDDDGDSLSVALVTQLLLSVEGDAELHAFGNCLEWILSSLSSSSLKADCAKNIQKLLQRMLAVCNLRDKPICLELCQFLKLWFPDPGLSAMPNALFLGASQGLMQTARDAIVPPVDLLYGAAVVERRRHCWFALFSQAHSEFAFASTLSFPWSKLVAEYLQDGSCWLSYQVDCITAWNMALWAEAVEFSLASASSLLSRLATYKDLNLILMIGLLSGFENEAVLQWLNCCASRSQGDLFKMHALSSIAEILCHLYGMDDLAVSYANMNLQCIVNRRLKEIGMTADGSVVQGEIDEEVILKKMTEHKNISAAEVEEICFLCGLDTEKMFLKYLEHLLLSWTPKYNVKVLLNGQEEIVILNSVDEIHKVFCFVYPLIRSELLCTFLHEIWEKVNYYHYEIYDAILDILIRNNSKPQFVLKQKNMIRFLQTYNRVSPPTSMEMNFYYEMGNLPEIAKWRLPLLTNSYKNTEEALQSHLTSVSVATSIVDSEINFQNYSKWLKAPQIEGIDSRTICSLALKQGYKMYLHDGISNKEWQVYPSKEDFLLRVKDCVMQMPNLKYATAAMNFTATKLPPGVDQVIAMELCLSLAKLWLKDSGESDEAKVVVEKVENKYLTLSLKNILYKYGFGKPKYLQMIGQPKELISSLYYDVTTFESSVLARKDEGLDLVAERIANLFSIDLLKLKLKLISKWIAPKEENIPSLEMSCVGEMFAKEGRINAGALCDDIKRLLHICKSVDKNVVLDHLMSLNFTPFLTSVKLKIILCIRELDESHATSILDAKNGHDLGAYVKKLYLLLLLEGHGIVRSHEEYESVDMGTLVRSILGRKPLHPVSVTLAAKFCLSSGVFDHSLWSEIFINLMKLSMFQELADLLPLLGVHCSFIAVQPYRDAWKRVVEAPFNESKHSLTFEEESKCLSSLQLFHLCPFLLELDLNGIAAKCLKSGRVELAALILPLLPPPQRMALKAVLETQEPAKDLVLRLKSLPTPLQVYSHQVAKILCVNDLR
ncbi:uncharacterized protein LOC124171901 [Ischnura elegans]|uniref:uncharacterized protein LOC124171901 n=1 Tax=Ischnura elegans TaxID=197161 RepID=UPI001ED887BF|nr:uncharacterized protein LOC124171901 [Ischnura elegans]